MEPIVDPVTLARDIGVQSSPSDATTPKLSFDMRNAMVGAVLVGGLAYAGFPFDKANTAALGGLVGITGKYLLTKQESKTSELFINGIKGAFIFYAGNQLGLTSPGLLATQGAIATGVDWHYFSSST